MPDKTEERLSSVGGRSLLTVRRLLGLVRPAVSSNQLVVWNHTGDSDYPIRLLFRANDGNVHEISGSVVRTGRQRLLNWEAKVGATAGWVLGGGAVDTGMMATCPASQTASTLVVPVCGLHVGDVITKMALNGQVESGGNTVTLDADLRAMTAVASGSTDASIGAITQVSVTADTLLSSANAVTSTLSESVIAGKAYYVLLTATTGASTDIELLNVEITYTTS